MEPWMAVSIGVGLVLMVGGTFLYIFVIQPKLVRARLESLGRRGYTSLAEPDEVLRRLFPIMGETEITKLTLKFGMAIEHDGVKRYLCLLRYTTRLGHKTQLAWGLVMAEARPLALGGLCRFRRRLSPMAERLTKVSENLISSKFSEVTAGLEPEFGERFVVSTVAGTDTSLPPAFQQALAASAEFFPFNELRRLPNPWMMVSDYGWAIVCRPVHDERRLKQLIETGDRLSNALR